MIPPPNSLVENTITVLAYDNEHGRIVASLVTPNLFSGDYKLIAERVLEYWRVQRQAPMAHLADLFEDIWEKADASADTLRYNLSQMHTLSQSMNARYVVDSLSKFIRIQTMKSEVLKAAEVLQRGGETTVEEAEAILAGLVNARRVAFDPGLSLEDVDRVMDHLAHIVQDDIMIGIGPLDQNRLALRRGTLTCLVGEAKAGKTWFLIHCGRRALLQRKKVVHVTLEIDEAPLLLRY